MEVVTDQEDITDLKIYRHGKNVYSNEVKVLYVNGSQGVSVQEIDTGFKFVYTEAIESSSFFVLDIGAIDQYVGKKLTLSIVCKSDDYDGSIVGKNVRLLVCDNDGSNRTTLGEAMKWADGKGVTTTEEIPSEYIGKRLALRVYGAVSNMSVGVEYEYKNVQVEVGDTATDYEPFSGNDAFTYDASLTIPALSGTNILYANAGALTVTGRADSLTVISGILERVAALETAAVNNT